MIKVLDGYVDYIDHMGSDQRIVDAARTSTGLDIIKDETRNRQLIRYLLRHRHTSPFEFCELTVKIKLPIFVMRQLIRHRTANVNEISGRYSQLKEDRYRPALSRMQTQSKDNHQGSNEECVDEDIAIQMLDTIDDLNSRSFYEYDKFIKGGLTREVARIILPLNTYTECYFKMDLHNLMHFLKLRMDDHAQYEMQEYANAIYTILKDLFPITMEAFDDYMLNARTLSKQEIDYLKLQLEYYMGSRIGLPPTMMNTCGMTRQECDEFSNKMGYNK